MSVGDGQGPFDAVQSTAFEIRPTEVPTARSLGSVPDGFDSLRCRVLLTESGVAECIASPSGRLEYGVVVVVPMRSPAVPAIQSPRGGSHLPGRQESAGRSLAWGIRSRLSRATVREGHELVVPSGPTR